MCKFSYEYFLSFENFFFFHLFWILGFSKPELETLFIYKNITIIHYLRCILLFPVITFLMLRVATIDLNGKSNVFIYFFTYDSLLNHQQVVKAAQKRTATAASLIAHIDHALQPFTSCFTKADDIFILASYYNEDYVCLSLTETIDITILYVIYIIPMIIIN